MTSPGHWCLDTSTEPFTTQSAYYIVRSIPFIDKKTKWKYYLSEVESSSLQAMSTGMEIVLLRVGTAAPSFPCSPPVNKHNDEHLIINEKQNWHWLKVDRQDISKFIVPSFTSSYCTCSFTLNGSFPMLLRHSQAAKALTMANRTSASRVRWLRWQTWGLHFLCRSTHFWWKWEKERHSLSI